MAYLEGAENMNKVKIEKNSDGTYNRLFAGVGCRLWKVPNLNSMTDHVILENYTGLSVAKAVKCLFRDLRR